MDKKKILLVDDEVSFTRLLKLNLEGTGQYIADVANCGVDGVKAVQANKPDLVLLDIMMPGELDGIKTLKKIKEIDPEIPVAMVTAVWNEQEGKRAFEAGAYEYITKPIDLEYLKRAVLVKLF